MITLAAPLGVETPTFYLGAVTYEQLYECRRVPRYLVNSRSPVRAQIFIFHRRYTALH